MSAGRSSFDVLIVGAGIIGAACAYRLAARGLSVCVLEAAEAPATGSTAKSAAGVRVQFSSAANVALSWASIQEYAAFEDLYGHAADYRPYGYLFLVPEAAWPGHLAAVDVQRVAGAPVQVLELAEAAKIVPFDPEGLAGATFGPRDGFVDPHGITLAYLTLARRLGAELRVAAELLSAERSAGAWRVVTTSCEVSAPAIVNAAGAWSRIVGARAGLVVPVDPVRRMVFASAPLGEEHRYPLSVDVATGFYLRSEGQRLLMGRSNPDEPVGFTEGIDWAWLEPTLEAGLSRFPWLAEVSLDRRASWWGYYEVTPDHCPLLGRRPEAEGWLDACGFSGHGVQQAPAVATAIAEELIDGRAKSFDIDEFRSQRFADGASHRHGKAGAGKAAIEKHIV